MPQAPFPVDVLQIEPGSSGTRTIDRDSSDGALRFRDSVLTAGVRLPDIVGLRSVEGVFVVGRAGAGAAYTTVQSAIDAVPNSSSSSEPSVVLVMPGVYEENLVIQKDGITIWAPGGATLSNDGDSDTVSISASQEVTPRSVVFRDLIISNDRTGRACVRVVGADVFATGSATVVSAPLVAGDTLTIGGVVLTGVGATRTSGNDDFSILGGTPGTIAAQIVAAVNDPLNSFVDVVTASSVGAVVTFTAVVAGSPGNGVTLATSTTPSGGITISGPNLTGGSSSGNLVGVERMDFLGCEFLQSDVGGFSVVGETSNRITIKGGTFWGSPRESACQFSNCGYVRIFDVDWLTDMEIAYNNAEDEPDFNAGEHRIGNCPNAGDFLVNFSGAGILVANTSQINSLDLSGDMPVTINNSLIGPVTMSDTSSLFLYNSYRTTMTVGGGTPVALEPSILVSVTFSSSTSETVTFDIEQPDANYLVLLESGDFPSLSVTNKTVSGFDIEASAPHSGVVRANIRRA